LLSLLQRFMQHRFKHFHWPNNYARKLRQKMRTPDINAEALKVLKDTNPHR
jgi:hypothetical protein